LKVLKFGPAEGWWRLLGPIWEKWRGITWSQGRKKHPTYSKQKKL